MKKALFFAIFLFFSGAIWLNLDKLNSDIFAFVDVKLNKYESAVVSTLKRENSFSILVKNQDEIKKIDEMIQNSNLFNPKSENSFELSGLNKFKLALLDEKSIKTLEKNSLEFFKNSAKNIFSPIRILPVSEDFFDLVNVAGLDLGVRLDPQSKSLKSKNFYFLNYDLKDKFDENGLLDLTYELKKTPNLYLNSPTLYSAYAKKIALDESAYLGVLSLFLSVVFMLLAFGNFRVLQITFVMLFSLVCGLGGALLILDSVHFLTLVISTSLIGLIVDYSMHFLSANMSVKIAPNSAKPMFKIFLTGLFITASGYAIFLFSPMKFLHEVAVLSVFSMISAFFATYFLLPVLLVGREFKSSNIFEIFLCKYSKICEFFWRKKMWFFGVILIIFAFGLMRVFSLNYADNIKSYSSLPTFLQDDVAIFSKEINSVKPKFIVVNSQKSRALIDSLEGANLVKNPFFISKFINSPAKQTEIKELFKRASKDARILEIYENFGLEKDDVIREFEKIKNAKIFNLAEICTEFMGEKCSGFIMEDKEFIYVDELENNKQALEILAKFDAFYSDYISDLNKSFTDIKTNAIVLKLCGFVLAFLFLWWFIGFKNSTMVVSTIIFCSLFSVGIFAILGLSIDIFTIFGLILGSAVGIDYMLFAFNLNLNSKERILGIITASITSIISFGVLMLSSTAAVFSFGFAVGISVFLCAFFASLFATVNCKI